MGTEVYHADGRAYRHDEGNSRFSQFRERAWEVWKCVGYSGRDVQSDSTGCGLVLVKVKLHSVECVNNSWSFYGVLTARAQLGIHTSLSAAMT
jgi:hypothetical protein